MQRVGNHGPPHQDSCYRRYSQTTPFIISLRLLTSGQEMDRRPLDLELNLHFEHLLVLACELEGLKMLPRFPRIPRGERVVDEVVVYRQSCL